MCRSIKTLRPPHVEWATDSDVHEAALQYVRKVSGYRTPAQHNVAAFDQGVVAVAAATRTLLDALQVGRAGAVPPPASAAIGHGRADR